MCIRDIPNILMGHCSSSSSSSQAYTSKEEQVSLDHLRDLRARVYPTDSLDKMGPRGTLYRQVKTKKGFVTLQIKVHRPSSSSSSGTPLTYLLVVTGDKWEKDTIIFSSFQCEQVSDVSNAVAEHIRRFGVANIPSAGWVVTYQP